MVRQGQKFQRPSKAVRRGLACGRTWKKICRDLYDGMNKIMLVFEASAGCPEKRYCLPGDFRYGLGLDNCFRGGYFQETL
jgi:hypothetical protein